MYMYMYILKSVGKAARFFLLLERGYSEWNTVEHQQFFSGNCFLERIATDWALFTKSSTWKQNLSDILPWCVNLPKWAARLLNKCHLGSPTDLDFIIAQRKPWVTE